MHFLTGKRGILAAGLLLLGGCDMTPEKFEATRTALEGSPGLVQHVIKTCEADYRSNPSERHSADAIMRAAGVKLSPEVFCTRVIAGIAKGKLTVHDYNSGGRGQATPAMIAVVRGR